MAQAQADLGRSIPSSKALRVKLRPYTEFGDSLNRSEELPLRRCERRARRATLTR